MFKFSAATSAGDRSGRRRAIGVLAALALASGVASAAYPERPIKIIVPFPAGGGTDIVGRLVGRHLEAELGQPVVFDNKAGAATVIGTEVAAQAAPDGYTLLFTSSAFTANASLMKKLPYDPLRSFTPIGSAALHPFVLVAHPSMPFNNFKEFVAYAKANPGKLTYASVGIGSTHHLGMELLKRMAGLDIVHVPYKGSSPATADLLGGQVNIMFNGVSPTLKHIQAGKLKVLANNSDRRVPVLPDVPTIAEQGIPGYKVNTWSGLLAPAGMPADVKDKLATAWAKVMAKPDVQKALADRGLVPNPLTPAEFAQLLKEDKEDWAELVRGANVTPE